ncbi:MAG TPA: insulinase family protein, partial [Burkholderiaceae bacterium]
SRARYARLANASADTAPVRRAIATPDKENGYYTARINLDLNQEDPQYPALVLANFIFGDSGLKSRLLERIRQRDGLSYSGGSSLGAGQIDRAGNFTITAIAAPQNLPRLEAAIQEELARTLRDGYTEQEVADAKSAILQQRAQARADDSGIADGWTRYLFMDRTYAYSKAFEDKLSAVTLQEVNSAFRQAIEPQRLTVVVAGDYVKAEAFARAKDKKEGAGGVAAMMAPSK